MNQPHEVTDNTPEHPLKYYGRPDCRAGRDGDCTWSGCPQLRDGEPEKSNRHCPLDVPGEEW